MMTYWREIYFAVGGITVGLFYTGTLLHKIFRKNAGVSYNPLKVFIGFVISLLIWPITFLVIGYAMMQDEAKILTLSREIYKLNYKEEIE